jgi:hypothetical protein
VNSYNATLRILGVPPAGGANISITVTVGQGLVRPADRTLIVSSDTTAAQLGGTVPVNLHAGEPVPFSAQSDVPWLTLPVSSGQTGDSLTFGFDNAEFRALPNGQVHVAHITLNSSRANISPVAFQVSVDKRLGEVTGLGPYLHTAGEPLRFYVRGTGLSLPGNIANRLQLDGITGANITTINDTTLLVTASAHAAGDQVVSMSNALGLAMPHSTLKIIDPVTSQYRAIPTGDIPAAVFYDAGARPLLGRHRVRPCILRRAGANWTDMPSGITCRAFGIAHDGSAVLVGGGGSMNFLDPQNRSASADSQHGPARHHHRRTRRFPSQRRAHLAPGARHHQCPSWVTTIHSRKNAARSARRRFHQAALVPHHAMAKFALGTSAATAASFFQPRAGSRNYQNKINGTSDDSSRNIQATNCARRPSSSAM